MGKQGQGWEKSYLRVMMLAWPLGEEEASSRSVGLDIVTRKGGTCRVMLGRNGWCNGEGDYLVYQGACLAFKGMEGFH